MFALKNFLYVLTHALVLIICQFFIQEDNFNDETYEIIKPNKVGADGSKIVMGKHSGRHAFKHKLLEMGFDLKNNEIEYAFHLFKKLADSKKIVSDKQIEKLIKSI